MNGSELRRRKWPSECLLPPSPLIIPFRRWWDIPPNAVKDYAPSLFKYGRKICLVSRLHLSTGASLWAYGGSEISRWVLVLDDAL